LLDDDIAVGDEERDDGVGDVFVVGGAGEDDGKFARDGGAVAGGAGEVEGEFDAVAHGDLDVAGFVEVVGRLLGEEGEGEGGEEEEARGERVTRGLDVVGFSGGS